MTLVRPADQLVTALLLIAAVQRDTQDEQVRGELGAATPHVEAALAVVRGERASK